MTLLKKWSENYIEAGCDEVGRGCLCGPVVAAAVILDESFEQNLVNDSKKLTLKTRFELDDYLYYKEVTLSVLFPFYFLSCVRMLLSLVFTLASIL